MYAINQAPHRDITPLRIAATTAGFTAVGMKLAKCAINAMSDDSVEWSELSYRRSPMVAGFATLATATNIVTAVNDFNRGDATRGTVHLMAAAASAGAATSALTGHFPGAGIACLVASAGLSLAGQLLN